MSATPSRRTIVGRRLRGAPRRYEDHPALRAVEQRLEEAAALLDELHAARGEPVPPRPPARSAPAVEQPSAGRALRYVAALVLWYAGFGTAVVAAAALVTLLLTLVRG